jgi:hypothetical protein
MSALVPVGSHESGVPQPEVMNRLITFTLIPLTAGVSPQGQPLR